ncbi:nicotinate (nicotinamide) nucleotide adenylyltransferase [bacterium]|nr:MAG: nicotinate (nicotinamide) nucleotide adenylyltransferase [bacterium]
MLVKLGILGGTFDPIHFAHLYVAEAARTAVPLDCVLFTPTGSYRHRSEEPEAPMAARVEMLTLAIASNPAFRIEDADLTGTGYTADLIPRLRAKYPHDELYFIAGADSLASSPWRRLDEVFAALDGFVVATRAGIDAPLPPEIESHVSRLEIPQLFTSASRIRALAREGHPTRYLVPDEVAAYIVAHRLYGARSGAERVR